MRMASTLVWIEPVVKTVTVACRPEEGSVLAWQSPTRVAFSFHPGRDAMEAQTVEVTFSAAPEGTIVVLTHSGWEKLSANAQQARDNYNQGWEGVFVTAYPEHLRHRNQMRTAANH